MLRSIVKDKVQSKPVPRSLIWDAFIRETGLTIEKYRFERDLSELIRNNDLPGFEMKQGRNGGLIRSQPKERIILKANGREFVGLVPKNELKKFISIVEVENVINTKTYNKDRMDS